MLDIQVDGTRIEMPKSAVRKRCSRRFHTKIREDLFDLADAFFICFKRNLQGQVRRNALVERDNAEPRGEVSGETLMIRLRVSGQEMCDEVLQPAFSIGQVGEI